MLKPTYLAASCSVHKRVRELRRLRRCPGAPEAEIALSREQREQLCPGPSVARGAHRPRLCQSRPGRPLCAGAAAHPGQPRRAERGEGPEGSGQGEPGRERGRHCPDRTLWPPGRLCPSAAWKRPEGQRAESPASPSPQSPRAAALPCPGTGLSAPPVPSGQGRQVPPGQIRQALPGQSCQPRAEVTPPRSFPERSNFFTLLLEKSISPLPGCGNAFHWEHLELQRGWDGIAGVPAPCPALLGGFSVCVSAGAALEGSP